MTKDYPAPNVSGATIETYALRDQELGVFGLLLYFQFPHIVKCPRSGTQ
jgi:hypothetical protein